MNFTCPFCTGPMKTQYQGTLKIVTCTNHPFDDRENYTEYVSAVEFTSTKDKPRYSVFVYNQHYLYVDYQSKYSRLFKRYNYKDIMWDSLLMFNLEDNDWDISDFEATMARIKTLYAFS